MNPRIIIRSALVISIFSFFCISIIAQTGNPPRSGGQRPAGRPPGAPPPPGRGGPGPLRFLDLVKKYDRDKDGILNISERREARKEAQSVERAPFRGGKERRPVNSSPVITPDQVTHYPNATFYDETILRTLFLDFKTDDWEQEMADFWHTDVELPADLTVDGKNFKGVGVRFRGSSSFFTVGKGYKRSLNISVDYLNKKQRIYGYKTLNLLNSHTDATFVRTVLFNHVARRYLPAPKANYVKLVINGQNWGIYVNEQQFNKEFQEEWFGSRKGIRWKMGPNPKGGFGLGYLGEDIESYGLYRLKSKTDEAKAWKEFIHLCKTLNQTPPDQLQAALAPIFNVDRALWFLALENVFADGDGYWTRASDFTFLQDQHGRFQMIPHDSNETFRKPRGSRRGGPAPGYELDPLFGINNEEKPLIYRLLAVAEFKNHYLAHVRTLAEDSLDWNKLKPLIEQFQSLISDEIKKDPRKLDSHEHFIMGVTETITEEGFRGPRESPSLKEFIQERQKYLLNYSAIEDL